MRPFETPLASPTEAEDVPTSGCPFSSRRGLLATAASMLATSTVAGGAVAQAPGASAPSPGTSAPATASSTDGQIPFHGRHQAGIVTPQQTCVLFASFDLVTEKASEVIGMLQNWTEPAARMTAGQTAEALSGNVSIPPPDSGDALGLGPRRLTLTFGFGPGLFEKDDKDRYGLRAKRPPALLDQPRFNGDQFVRGRTGGDLCIQACADDSAVTFHAIRQLARIAAPNDAANGYGGKRAGAAAAYDAKPGAAELRSIHAGFLPDSPPGQTPRNLMGFKDGTQNPYPAERAGGRLIGNGTFDEVVWVGNEGPDWMRDGSYLVVRMIRIALQHWDKHRVRLPGAGDRP